MIDPVASKLELHIGLHDLSITQSPSALRSDRAGGTTGAVVWRSSVLLGQALNEPDNLLYKTGIIGPSSTVLELGSGVAGILPIILSSRVARYLATDQKYTLRLLEENIRSNVKAPLFDKIDCLPLDWEEDDLPSLLKAHNSDGAQLVVACDCVYNFALIEPLVQTMASVCRMKSDEQTTCLILQPLRQPDVFEAWLETMLRVFAVYRLDSDLFGAETGSGHAAHIAILRSDKRYVSPVSYMLNDEFFHNISTLQS